MVTQFERKDFRWERTTTCACHLIPKTLIPFQVKNDVLFSIAIIKALHVVYCIGGILFEKKIGSGEMVQTWDVVSNYEQGRESGSMQKPNGCLHFTMEPLNTLRNLTPCFTVYGETKCVFFPSLKIWIVKFPCSYLNCSPYWIGFIFESSIRQISISSINN
jgi:hypothetical protein